MSFGDLKSQPSLTPSPPSPAPSPRDTELQRLLKPFALNNAALAQISSELTESSTPSTHTLKRMRALRAQNRNIEAAATTLLATQDLSSEHGANAELQTLLKQFEKALMQSIHAERAAVKRLDAQQQSEANAHAQQGQSLPPSHRRDEQVALLQRKDQLVTDAQPVYRAVDMRDAFLDDRRSAMTRIQTSVNDVNVIFKDLAVMVNDQSDQVELVDVAVEESAMHIENATAEMRKTQIRRARRKSLFFCTLFVIAMIISITLFLLFN